MHLYNLQGGVYIVVVLCTYICERGKVLVDSEIRELKSSQVVSMEDLLQVVGVCAEGVDAYYRAKGTVAVSVCVCVHTVIQGFPGSFNLLNNAEIANHNCIS